MHKRQRGAQIELAHIALHNLGNQRAHLEEEKQSNRPEYAWE
jgi:hypothetical protein